MSEGKLKERIKEYVRQGMLNRDAAFKAIDEARADLESKAKTINDCGLFPGCWGKVVRLNDVYAWFGHGKETKK